MPICGEETEVYSRVTGYFRPLKCWHRGKLEEFKDRKVYVIQPLPTHKVTKPESKLNDLLDGGTACGY